MANRKDKETTGTASGAASGAGMSPMDAAAEMGGTPERVDAEAMADMGPRGSRAKVNEESGDLYYPEGAPTPARAAPTRAAAAAPARARPNLVSREEGMKGYVPRRAPAARPDYSNEGRTYEPKAKVRPRVLSMSDELNPTESTRNPRTGRPYKKGGAVKKMANGGATSASKRADGIASRGKTKCKMY
jgi:hypothetical protein